MSEPSMLDRLADYLGIRERQRREDVERLVGGLTVREVRLVREAAVMGYVQGAKNGLHRDKIPGDGEIAYEVLDACLHFPELYPTITGYVEEES